MWGRGFCVERFSLLLPESVRQFVGAFDRPCHLFDTLRLDVSRRNCYFRYKAAKYFEPLERPITRFLVWYFPGMSVLLPPCRDLGGLPFLSDMATPAHLRT